MCDDADEVAGAARARSTAATATERPSFIEVLT
jgi:hypothetical protein